MTGGVETERVQTGGAPAGAASFDFGGGGVGRGGELSSGCCCCCCCAFAAAALPPSASGDGDLGGGDAPSLDPDPARGRLLLLCRCCCSLSLRSPPPPPRSLRSPRATSNAALPSSPPTLTGASRIELGSHPLAIRMSLLSCLATRGQSTCENACAARAALRPQPASSATRWSPPASISPSVAALAATPTNVLWK